MTEIKMNFHTEPKKHSFIDNYAFVIETESKKKQVFIISSYNIVVNLSDNLFDNYDCSSYDSIEDFILNIYGSKAKLIKVYDNTEDFKITFEG